MRWANNLLFNHLCIFSKVNEWHLWLISFSLLTTWTSSSFIPLFLPFLIYPSLTHLLPALICQPLYIFPVCFSPWLSDTLFLFLSIILYSFLASSLLLTPASVPNCLHVCPLVHLIRHHFVSKKRGMENKVLLKINLNSSIKSVPAF